MQHLLGAEAVLEHMIGFSEGLLHISATQMEIQRDVGVAFVFEMFQVGKGARRLQHLVHHGFRVHRLDFVEHRRQFFVFGNNQLRRRFGDMRISGQHQRHRFTDVMHLVDRQNWLVVEGRAVIRLGDQFADVGRGVDRINARHCLRRSNIDIEQARVRHRAAMDLAVQHAGEPQVVHILRFTRYFGARLDAGNRLADGRKFGCA